MRRLLLPLVILLLAPGFACAAADRSPAGVPWAEAVSATTAVTAGAAAPVTRAGAGSLTGPDPYWTLDGNGGTNAIRYNILVGYDFAERRLRGRTVIAMKARQDLTSFSLDLLLPATAVRIDGRAVRFTRPNQHELRVLPGRTIPAGTVFRVDVAYQGQPGRVAYAGERNWLANRYEVVTMNQPHMAPWWFPSNDHPSDKALFDIRVTVPRGKRVVSNGTYVRRTVSGRRATTHWRMSDPMATYLAFFAAGDFVLESGRTRQGIRYHNAVSERLPSGVRLDALRTLRRTAGITDWLQAWLGPYPFTSTGGVVTSLDVGFALENQTRPTYGAWIYPSVIVHEIAHQWFGNSVSVSTWRDIWINEGFATFAEVAYDARHGGQSVASWLRSQYGAQCSYPDDGFWRLDLRDPGAAQIFATAVYDRGAMVLAALHNRLGETWLRSTLRAWAVARHDGNATVAQFEAFADARTDEDLSGFFDAWLGGGVPEPTADNGLDRAC
ncbi:MAG TPA: M1 family metallopeptidase [Nocardioides sp.]|nr:M1 family metallopeptidase [Nocardioides sp.]